MPTATVTVGSASGLHARPASLFSQAALASGATVTIAKADGKPVNAASILGLLTLGVGHGEEVTLTTEGDNADEALASLTALLESNLDEQ
jgi:phosphocarrier protein HPr